MKFIIVSLGSKGDSHPLLAMARIIKEHGHEIIFVSTGNYNFSQLAAQYEIPFHKILDDKICDDLLKHDVEGGKKVFYKLFKEFYIDYAAPKIIDAIKKLNKPGETIVITGPAGIIGSYLAGELHNIPVVVAHLAPLTITSFSSPGRFDSFDVMNQISTIFQRAHLSNRWATIFRHWLHRAIIVPFFEGPYVFNPLNDYRKQLGLAKIKPHLGSRWFSQADLSLGLFPKWLHQKLNAWGDEEPPEDLPQNTHFAGFPFFDERTEEYTLPLEVKVFLENNQPVKPLIATFGSGNIHQKKIFTVVSDVCRELNYPAIFLGSHDDNKPDNLPENVLFVQYLPLSAILPHASICIHHGGVGTVGLCLQAGVPQIVRPGFGDQFDISARIKKLGCGIEMAVNSFTTNQLKEAIKLVSNESYLIAAKNIQAKIQNETSFDDNFEKIFSEMCKLCEVEALPRHKKKFYADC